MKSFYSYYHILLAFGETPWQGKSGLCSNGDCDQRGSPLPAPKKPCSFCPTSILWSLLQLSSPSFDTCSSFPSPHPCFAQLVTDSLPWCVSPTLPDSLTKLFLVPLWVYTNFSPPVALKLSFSSHHTRFSCSSSSLGLHSLFFLPYLLLPL